MKELRFYEFPAERYSRKQLATYTNQQIIDLANADDEVESYTPAEFTAMLNDNDAVSDSWFFSAEVELEHEANAWTVTEGDFDDYMLDGISQREIDEMIDQVAEDMGNNDCVDEDYWMTIEHVMEERGFQKKSSMIKCAKRNCNNKNIDYKYARCSICTKDDHQRTDDMVIALYEFDVTEQDDEQIYFYCQSKEEFIRICKEGADDFIICGISEFSTSL